MSYGDSYGGWWFFNLWGLVVSESYGLNRFYFFGYYFFFVNCWNLSFCFYKLLVSIDFFVSFISNVRKVFFVV